LRGGVAMRSEEERWHQGFEVNRVKMRREEAEMKI
jgi:hypothetical protein